MDVLTLLDEYLQSDVAPEGCMQLSDLDGFLTGIICSPELIMPSKWLPVVWGDTEAKAKELDRHIAAIQAVLQRYNEIAAALNSEPPFIEPVFWQAPEGHAIAMDWCEGFMMAVGMHAEAWDELLVTEQGREWMFPVFAHLFDEKGNPLIGADERELDKVLDMAAVQIPETIPLIYTFWKSRRSIKA